MAQTREVAALAKRILVHLAENPGAQDTVEGITRWWLLQQDILKAIALVEAALASLIAQQAVTKYEGPDGTIHYRANSHH